MDGDGRTAPRDTSPVMPEPLALEAALAATDTRRTRRAVLAGVGEARNHPDRGDAPTDAVALMAEAALAAAKDLGDPCVLDAVGLVAAPVGSDDAPDPAGAVRDRLHLAGARTMVAAIGVPQQRLVSQAVLAVETGAADAVLVVGGEAKASQLHCRRAGTDAPVVAQGPGADDLLVPHGELMGAAEVAAMWWDPVAQYALIDSTLARVGGSSPRRLRDDVSALWARFDAVAASRPDALFAGPRSAAELAATTEENRLLAYPYNKWHSTQWALDHAAALIICSEDLARRHGAAAEALLHPIVALDSSWGLTLSRRAEPHRWPAMELMGDIAADHLGAAVGDLGVQELYSCFPAAVRLQQRALGLPLDGTPTVVGGMPFFGGPFNHFTYMATAAVARVLRDAPPPDARALVTTVSGLLTKGGLMVWGREPHPDGVLVADLAEQVDAATATVELADFDPGRTIRGDDRVVAATVTGGFDPGLLALVDDDAGVRRVVSAPAPEGDPADALATI